MWRKKMRASVFMCIIPAFLITGMPGAGQAYAQVFRGYTSTGLLDLQGHPDKRREVVKGYYPGGQVEFSASFRKGKLDGDLKEYYESGMLKAEIPYDNGDRNGMAKFYHDNGMLMCKVYYENNKEKRARFYDKSGLLTASVDVDRSGIKLRKRHEKRRREDSGDHQTDSLEDTP